MKRIPVLVSLQVGVGKIHASPLKHLEGEVQKLEWGEVLLGVMVDVNPREAGNPGLVWVYSVQEGGLQECLVWMKNLVDPLEDQVLYFELQQGLLGV